MSHEPTTPVEVGVKQFVEWYCNFYMIRGLEGYYGSQSESLQW